MGGRPLELNLLPVLSPALAPDTGRVHRLKLLPAMFTRGRPLEAIPALAPDTGKVHRLNLMPAMSARRRPGGIPALAPDTCRVHRLDMMLAMSTRCHPSEWKGALVPAVHRCLVSRGHCRDNARGREKMQLQMMECLRTQVILQFGARRHHYLWLPTPNPLVLPV